MNSIESAIAKASTPLARAIVEAERRLDAIEKGTTRAKAEQSARDLLKMIDSLEDGKMSVSDLPHIKGILTMRRAFGLQSNMPEVS